MAAVSFQPIAPTASEAADQTPTRQTNQAAANNAPSVAVPSDTVSVSGVAVAAARAGQGTSNLSAQFVPRTVSIPPFASTANPAGNGSTTIAEPVSAASQASAAAAAAASAGSGQATAQAVAQLPIQEQIQVAVAAPTPAAANAGAGAAAAADTSNAATTAQTANSPLTATPAQLQQQQLAQLDQILASLGIDPQSIPQFNQVVLLEYLNDPAGLQRVVEQLQQSPFQTPQQVNSTIAANGTVGNGIAQQLQELQNTLAQTQSASSPGQALDVKA